MAASFESISCVLLFLTETTPYRYQIWVGGSPVLEGRTGFSLIDRVKMNSWEDTMEPLLKAFKAERSGPTEFFGDYCHRVGKGALLAKLV